MGPVPWCRASSTMSRVPYSPRVDKWTAPVPGKMLRGRLLASAVLVRGEFRLATSGLSLDQPCLARKRPRLAPGRPAAAVLERSARQPSVGETRNTLNRPPNLHLVRPAFQTAVEGTKSPHHAPVARRLSRLAIQRLRATAAV